MPFCFSAVTQDSDDAKSEKIPWVPTSPVLLEDSEAAFLAPLRGEFAVSDACGVHGIRTCAPSDAVVLAVFLLELSVLDSAFFEDLTHRGSASTHTQGTGLAAGSSTLTSPPMLHSAKGEALSEATLAQRLEYVIDNAAVAAASGGPAPWAPSEEALRRAIVDLRDRTTTPRTRASEPAGPPSNSSASSMSEASNDANTRPATFAPVVERHVVFVHGFGGGLALWLPQLRCMLSQAEHAKAQVLAAAAALPFLNAEEQEFFLNADAKVWANHHTVQWRHVTPRDSFTASETPTVGRPNSRADTMTPSECLRAHRIDAMTQLHAVDMPGFARSARAELGLQRGDADKAIDWMTERLSGWVEVFVGRSRRETTFQFAAEKVGKKAKAEGRQQPSAELPPLTPGARKARRRREVVLVGHSFGGYISCHLAMRFPSVIDRLVLADPWGVQHLDDETVKKMSLPRRALLKLAKHMTRPLQGVRTAGPFGKKLFMRVRKDFAARWKPHLDDTKVFYDYIYHCNAQPVPTGEDLFIACCGRPGFAKQPLQLNLPFGVEARVPIAIVIGSQTWLDVASMESMIQDRQAVLDDAADAAAAATTQGSPMTTLVMGRQPLSVLLKGGSVWDTAATPPSTKQAQQHEHLGDLSKPSVGEADQGGAGAPSAHRNGQHESPPPAVAEDAASSSSSVSSDDLPVDPATPRQNMRSHFADFDLEDLTEIAASGTPPACSPHLTPPADTSSFSDAQPKVATATAEANQREAPGVTSRPQLSITPPEQVGLKASDFAGAAHLTPLLMPQTPGLLRRAGADLGRVKERVIGNVSFEVVPDAGHQVCSDNAPVFNEALLRGLQL